MKNPSGNAATTCYLQKTFWIWEIRLTVNRFLEAFWIFFKIYPIKIEMKSSIERTCWDNGSCRSGDSLILCKRNVISLGKLIISKNFTFLTYFTRETTKVLGKDQFLKSHFSCRISIANSFNIKHVTSALAWPQMFFIETYDSFCSPSFFSTFKFFFYLFFYVCVVSINWFRFNWFFIELRHVFRFGKACTGDEREMAKNCASILSPRDIEVVMEGKEPDSFWKALGGKQPYSSSKAQLDPEHEPRLFQCSNATGYFRCVINVLSLRFEIALLMM